MHSGSLLLAVLPEDWENGGFGLYVHWPFCQAKCPYCDFNSHVSARIDQRIWQAAYLAEMDRAAMQTGGRILRSIFFGGGTPSMMEPELVDAIISKARAVWGFANDIEITLEANPTSVEAGRFSGYAGAGVNRISMGIQALNDADLRALGRLHSVDEAKAAFDVARNQFERVSFDLIYGRQNQSRSDWEQELRSALGMAIDHLSLYQLTIEEGTAFGDRYAVGKLLGLPDDDAAADMYEMTQDICGAAGFPAYEVSNHAKQDQECRHNLIYWRYGDYVGIGPGAHGRVTVDGTKYATESIRAPGGWLKAVQGSGTGVLPVEALGKDEMLAEFLLMGLRLTEGVTLDRFQELGGGIYINNINRLIDSSHMEEINGGLAVTGLGRPILNAVLREILRD